MEKFFKLKESGSNVRTEIIAGLTTFFTMAYIIFVNPSILSSTGMPREGVFVATILAAVIGTLIMGLVANVPYAQAAGMGLNAFFAYTVCGTMGFSWQEALAMVFVCGIINIIITVTKIRKSIIRSVPRYLQSAIGGGIGLFIAYSGLKNGGFLTYSASAEDMVNGVIPGADVVPALSNFSDPHVLLALIGLILTVVLLVLKVKGSIFIGIVITTLIGIPMGIVNLGGIDKIFDISAIGGIKETAGALFPGFVSAFSSPEKIFMACVTIFAFSLSDTFDTIGTFIGTGRVSGIFDEEDEKALMESKGFQSKMDKALFADATATSIGALLGTSNTTTYVESAAGIAAGGRTGLTSVVTAIMFLICLPFSSIIGIVPSEATAPALIVVGVMMMASFTDIKWSELEEAIPAFLTILIMTIAFNISYGIAVGFLFHCIIKLVKGEGKEVHPILYGAAGLFLVNFIVQALMGAGII